MASPSGVPSARSVGVRLITAFFHGSEPVKDDEIPLPYQVRKFDNSESSTTMRLDAAARDRWHGLPKTVRRAADAPEYLHIYPTTPNDLQKSFGLTMMRRRLRVSQETPESQGHRMHKYIATRGRSSSWKVPPATLITAAPRQLALQSHVPSLVLVIDSVQCRLS